MLWDLLFITLVKLSESIAAKTDGSDPATIITEATRAMAR
jgi:hypothetical protein